MTVSLCVIAYNEESFLPNLLNDLKKQTYPHEKIEIVLVDSASTDNTKKIMESFAAEDNRFYSVIVSDNPKKIQACGWNVAIKHATGNVIVRIDAHTHIPEEFTEKNMKLHAEGEFVTGGVRPCVIENPTPWRNMLLEVENSLFGSSIAKSRHGKKKTYVSSMFHAAYKREVFEKVGGFNENLLRTEDNEMHHRIIKAGYKLCFDPDIVSYQYARSSLKKMVKQKYGNGKWIGLTLGVCPGCISPFHLIPFCFVGGVLLTSVLWALGIWQLAAIMWSLYAIFALANTIISIVSNGFSIHKFIMPFLFLILHMSYGIGTVIGIFKMPFKRKTYLKCDEIDCLKECLKKKYHR